MNVLKVGHPQIRSWQSHEVISNKQMPSFCKIHELSNIILIGTASICIQLNVELFMLLWTFTDYAISSRHLKIQEIKLIYVIILC